MIPVENDWKPILEGLTSTETYQQLRQFLVEEYQTETVYPDMHDLWTAFQWTSYSDVKAVILGQDPYHGPEQAHGLSFSVKPGIKLPPSLRNIYKELKADLNHEPVDHGYLKKWADQGVLLLNSVLTVRQSEAHSHRGQGWEIVTDGVIEALNKKEEKVVFILWGNASIEKRALIDENKHAVLTSSHPSPFAAHLSFFGSHPFSKTNEILEQAGRKLIDWELPSSPNMK